MPYLSSSQISGVNSAMNDLHYFFATKNDPFYAVKDGTTTIISESVNHNAFYGAAPQNSEVVVTKVSGMFFARAYYLNKDDNFSQINFNGNNQKLPETANNIVKIITDSTGKSFLEDVDRIEWGGEWFEKASTPAKHGLLQKTFNTYYFEEVK